MRCAVSRDGRVSSRQLRTPLLLSKRRSHLGEVVAKRVAYQSSSRIERELAHCGGSVGLYRLDANIECPADHLVTIAFRDQLHNFTLARGQHGRMRWSSRSKIV